MLKDALGFPFPLVLMLLQIGPCGLSQIKLRKLADPRLQTIAGISLRPPALACRVSCPFPSQGPCDSPSGLWDICFHVASDGPLCCFFTVCGGLPLPFLGPGTLWRCRFLGVLERGGRWSVSSAASRPCDHCLCTRLPPLSLEPTSARFFPV